MNANVTKRNVLDQLLAQQRGNSAQILLCFLFFVQCAVLQTGRANSWHS